MGETIERTLAAFPLDYSQIWLGPAKLELTEAHSDAELKRVLNPQKGEHPWGELAIQSSGKKRTVDIRPLASSSDRFGILDSNKVHDYK